MEIVIKVEGMMCSHCKARVEKVCKAVPGTQDAVVDLAAKTVTVTGDADVSALKQAIRDAAKTGFVLAAQDHNTIGGLGYQVAAVIAEEGLRTKFKIAGISDRFVPMARPDYLYAMFEIDKNGLKKQILAMMGDADHV